MDAYLGILRSYDGIACPSQNAFQGEFPLLPAGHHLAEQAEEGATVVRGPSVGEFVNDDVVDAGQKLA
jgi:hypothetical protein